MNQQPNACRPADLQLAGMRLPELREVFWRRLFEVLLPFWDQYGIDDEEGGVICALNYDGSRAGTDKVLWFQGRAIWVYSFLYNHFDKAPRYLNIARQVRSFVLKHALQQDGWWAEVLSRKGKILRPFSGDIEGMLFIAEGFQEYAAATGDEQSREIAFTLLKKLFRYFDSPEFRYRGADFPYLWQSSQAIRPQGLWMLFLGVATQILRRWSDSEVSAISDRALDAIINRHYNPEIGLNTEMLNFDFSRPEEEQHKVRVGHCIEALWMAMDEAARRKDDAAWATCSQRICRHIDVGWDRVFGGLSQWINVDQPCYHWPVEHPPGTRLELYFIGEYEYMKPLWALVEMLIATLKVFERTRDEWAARYFTMAQAVIDEKFSRNPMKNPGSMLFTDRRMTWQPRVSRQDNYHPLRQLMLSILILDAMIQDGHVSSGAGNRTP